MTRLRSLGGHLALEGNIRVLAIQTVISQLGFGMFYVVWQPYLLSTGIGVVGVGVVQSVISLSTSAGLIIWGVLSDRFGRRPVIFASNACRVLAIVALLISGNLVFLLAFAFFVGFSCLFMQLNPARGALISESVSVQKRATAFSTLMALSQIISTLTASAGGYFALVLGFHFIFYACIGGDLAGLIWMGLFLKETGGNTSKKRTDSKWTTSRLTGYLTPEPRIVKLYAIMIFAGLGYGVGYSVFYSMLVDAYNFNTLQLGLLSTTFNLVGGASAIPLGRLADRFGRKPMLMCSCLMSLTTVLGYLISHSFEMFLLFNLTSALDMSFWLSAWMALVTEKAPPEGLSTIMGKLDSYSRIVAIPAPWFGGVLYSYYGFAAPLQFFLLCVVVYSALVATLKDIH